MLRLEGNISASEAYLIEDADIIACRTQSPLIQAATSQICTAIEHKLRIDTTKFDSLRQKLQMKEWIMRKRLEDELTARSQLYAEMASVTVARIYGNLPMISLK
jgi:hypothetical protein